MTCGFVLCTNPNNIHFYVIVEVLCKNTKKKETGTEAMNLGADVSLRQKEGWSRNSCIVMDIILQHNKEFYNMQLGRSGLRDH